ncbi:carboxyl-terminal processing protease [Natronospira proteinivora]|uniref:Carboxyl-terminal processing protease n=1 Tax=Natronospira proteinivora TaxID=1807133 RepID=A0ABT1G831_9GAMM|nr:carboxy terminal-processing peptidase [Natronospira proteinivora]MCP1726513.1 carboxyl-terminal processing protease [Natronospira proteinivora]
MLTFTRFFATLIALGLLTLSATPVAFAESSGSEAKERPCSIHDMDDADNGNGAPLEPSDRQLFLDRLIAGLLERHHLDTHEFDAEMAEEVFDNFLDNLDPGRHYLLAEDVEAFRERHRELVANSDGHGTGERIKLAFETFQRFRERGEDRIRFAQSYLDEKPDLEGEDELAVDREDAPWAKDEAELDTLWEKRVTNDVIGLIMAERDWDDARETLLRRYDNLRRNISHSDRNEVFELFINAHANALDPHTAYFSPRNVEEFEIRMSLSLEGIGAALQSDDEYITITEILPGGPADQDGTLRPQDRITGVAAHEDCDMEDIVGWRVDDAVQLIRGPEGSKVRLRYLPGDAVPGDPEKTIELVRSEVQLEEQAAKKEIKDVTLGDQSYRVGVIQIPTFYMDFQGRREGREDYRSTTRDVRRLLGELQEEGVDAVLVDLRNNGGGSLIEATELAGVFLDGGPVVQMLDTQGELEVAEGPDNGAEWDGPLGVMVNRFSASASEIFAGAIQDYGRGVIIGSPTYGKGTIQNLLDLDRWFSEDDDVGQLKFTIGKFYRVSGGSMQHRGVIPDLELPSAISLEDFGESTKPNALAWDEIASLEYDGDPLPRSLVEQLTEMHSERVSEDLDFNNLLDDIRRYREVQERRTLSLNLDKRRESQEDARERRLAQENVRRAARGEAALSELDGDEEATGDPDILLTESARILADFAALLPEYADHESRFSARREDR